ncbi:tyrosine-type recombinase/integrase [Pseudomonas oryzihabitans]|uniref:tyrosine-type recombinase/integrase n=1 Tax=Pseudomonas oryzihabitans TaxID=47885 RepID=UPI0011A6E148|nr:site-specific integrase [Pseudomonas oryzihabitans]
MNKNRHVSARVSLSDAAIRRAAGGEAFELTDPRHPPLRLRFHKSRARATWYIVQHRGGRPDWHKAGVWPTLTCGALLEKLPELIARLASPSPGSLLVGDLTTVGGLLDWYAERLGTARNLSKARRQQVGSVIRCHLRPQLGEVKLEDLDAGVLDARLVWPLQATHTLGHVRLVVQALKSMLKQAARLGLIPHNPLAAYMLSDSVKAIPRVKDGRLRVDHLPDLFAILAAHPDRAAVGLAVLQLCHGTRIGETRQARWREFDLVGGAWYIPAAHTKTKQAHKLPLTPAVCAFLAQYREKQQQMDRYAGTFLFPSPSRRASLTERQATEKYTNLTEGKWTSHDLRKLARTAWFELGVDFLIGELLLNHKIKGVQAAYIHAHGETLKRQALERWHDQLDTAGFLALHATTSQRPASHLEAFGAARRPASTAFLA